MKSSKVCYVTVNDSRLLASGAINIAGLNIPMSSFNFAEFKSLQRKTLVSCSVMEEGPLYGSAIGSRKISEQEMRLNISEAGPVEIEFAKEKFLVSAGDLSCGTYLLSVEVYLEVPLKAQGGVPEHIKPILHYSEVLRVIFRIGRTDNTVMQRATKRHPIYETYGELGFFIADLKRMNEYVVSRLGEGNINLKDAFCETEIANELFDRGLLILVWGVTPWTYYFYDLDSSGCIMKAPSLSRPQFTGVYKFISEIENPSLVPGDFLETWPDCLDLDFPRISLPGNVDSVQVDIHATGFYIPGVGIGPNLAVVTAYRNDDFVVGQPLLTADLESVESKLCFRNPLGR